MARTRSAKAAPAASKAASDSKSASSKFSLAPQSDTPSKLFILPSKATADARIVTLPNPRHLRPARYLVCPETGIYEFTKVAAPKTTPRSWLIETTSTSTRAEADADADKDVTNLSAETSTGQELYLATAIDPLFLFLPALAEVKTSKGSDEQKRMYLTSDDHFEKLPDESSHLSEILRCPKTRALMERRMGAICNTVEAGDESMFRLNNQKLVGVILDKAKRMSEGGLPPSMDEKFVKKALEAPILVQKREMKGGELVAAASQVSTPQTESAKSQSTVTSAETTESSESQPSTVVTSFSEEVVTEAIVSAMEASPEVIQLQRLRVAFNFICSNYVASTLAAQLLASLAKSDSSLVDFSPLDEYLSKLSKLRADALISRSMGDYSRKHDRDEEEDEARAEKKRKLEEEKKRKASESRGIRNLKKVNTTGMKKMSDFFKKK
ncbi:hypothetical protein AK830_g12220 [Neonectria ditissima]|uniref:Ribonuclease H2 subunit B n=1 Tax=Neonectria ditissima TaxID=78410 RepID=A0A0P7AB87_9HYPO|nr:hypothetical protein AK830_g12220 [Neonectria ditissima]